MNLINWVVADDTGELGVVSGENHTTGALHVNGQWRTPAGLRILRHRHVYTHVAHVEANLDGHSVSLGVTSEEAKLLVAAGAHLTELN